MTTIKELEQQLTALQAERNEQQEPELNAHKALVRILSQFVWERTCYTSDELQKHELDIKTQEVKKFVEWVLREKRWDLGEYSQEYINTVLSQGDK